MTESDLYFAGLGFIGGIILTTTMFLWHAWKQK